MAAPNDEELMALKEFRIALASFKIRLPEYQSTDLSLLTWLRARELNINSAVIMLQKSLEWRKANNIHNILNWIPPKNYTTEFPYKFIGNDAEGRLVLILPFGLWNLKKVMDSGENEIWLRYMDLLCGRIESTLRQTSEKIQKQMTQFVIIVDCAHFSFAQLASFASMESIKEFIRRFDSNYPEMLYKAIVINSSRVWMMAFKIMKSFMAVRTANKIELFSSPDQWKPELLKYVPQEVLPKGYGGNA